MEQIWRARIFRQMKAPPLVAVAAAFGFAVGVILFGASGDCAAQTRHLDSQATALAAEVTLLRQQVRAKLAGRLPIHRSNAAFRRG